jgi:zinc-binding alcohol dehydrogenase family protein
VILGWEFSGVIAELGSQTNGFQPGDEVYGAGDLTRQGAYAEYVAVDHRVIAKKPALFSFAEAAAIPMTSLTAWGVLFGDSDRLPPGVGNVLVVGAAGGVGSMAVQLLKARTDAIVIATASRRETKKWVSALGADLVLSHDEDMQQQLTAYWVHEVDYILSVNKTAEHISWISQVLRPYGHLGIIDIHKPADLRELFNKSVSIHPEAVFSRVIFDHHPEKHSRILNVITRLANDGKIISTVNRIITGLTAENMYKAHSLIEGGKTIGKIVIQFESAEVRKI